MAAPMRGFHPLTAAWFNGCFDGATEPQREAWPRIRAGRDVLISAPTGSGKTLAALLICLDGLVARAAGGGLEDRTEVVYVSPLKALSTDVHRNLDMPLSGITALAEAEGAALAPIRTAVRTGDTPVWEREKLARRPPHVLVTTPESLFILLTAERGRRALRDARVVVVDEIHAVADDKRGAHLALTLARLDDLVRKAGGVRPQRIGLSATVNPIEAIAGLLRGGAESAPEIVNAGHRRALDLAVEVPGEELGVVATNEMWGEIHDRIARLASEHRTTLVFVNTRRMAERIAHHLAERLGDDAVLAHHGSLSKQLRRKAETELKAGRLRAVVATASLELGIDVGSVELVCQIGSPRSIAVALQRVGRSGHKVDRRCVPKGRFFPTTRDELIETAALVRAIRRGLLDELTVPDWPRDVLAQQIVAATACEPWTEDDLFDLARSAYPYRDLPRGEFDAVVTMLSDGIATGRGRYGAYVHRDRVNRVLRGRRGGRLAAVTSGGAIPDNANYLVVAEPEGTTVGTVDEDFAVESLSGDVFLLGTMSWRIRRVEAGRVRVEDAHGAAPSIPFWRGEAPGRTRELSDEVSALRVRIAEAAGGAGARNGASGADAGSGNGGSGNSDDSGNGAAAALLEAECGLDAAGVEQAAAYVRAGVAALGALPSRRTVIAERFFDEGGGMQLVIHAPFGARINRAWGLALRKRFCRSFNFELQAAATDNGIVISLAEQHSFPLDAVFRFLRAESVEEVLTQAMLPAPMFTARWRWNASRALAVLRFAGGRKVPPPLQRMRSDDLLASVFPDQAACPENLTGEVRVPRHPLVDETVRDCLHEAMDLDGLRAVIAAMERGELETRAVETAEPSVFSHEILNANPYAFLDDAPLEERRARAVQLRRTLPESARDVGALDAAAIAEVAAESWPVVRDADELHDALLTLTVVPPAAEWRAWYAELERSRRAVTFVAGGRTLWTAAERRRVAEALHPDGRFSQETPDVPQETPESREAAAVEVVRGWLESSGPRRARGLAEALAAPRAVIDGALARLEGEGQVLRGRFSPDGAPPGAASGDDGDALEWCNRRVLARIHRLTLGRLRREIEPVTAADFVRFLARWQHVAPGARLHGAAGLLQVLRQLQGYETSAAAWESDVLARRVADYDPEMLDLLCLSGETMWGRLSPHPAFDGAAAAGASSSPAARPRSRRRVRPTRVAPLTFFLREDAAWLAPAAGAGAAGRAALSHAGRAVLEQLEVRGASFLRDLVRATGRLASEVEEGLWELAAAGLVTADGFDNLRALIDPKRRRGEGRFRAARPRHAAGRWALLRPEASGAAESAAAARGEAFARQLLTRWGVVFRDLIVREALAPPWRELLQALRRLEARGEVRGGRFVDGFLGEQFARPEAVESLRSVRRDPARPASGERLRVSAADPLNLVGIVVPGARVGALSGEAVDVLGPLYIDVQ